MPTTQRFDVSATFAVKAPRGLAIEGYADESHPNVPPLRPYLFRQGLNAVLAFLRDAAGDALLLTGPTGAGKTSLIRQVAARLYWPVQEVTCHGRLEFADLLGGFQLLQGETRFVHGPLAIAAREGHLLILNEIDLMDPAELAGLNDIVEGAPLVIAQNGGEVIRPHRKFRVIATGNSAGGGDSTGLYPGVGPRGAHHVERLERNPAHGERRAPDRPHYAVPGRLPHLVRAQEAARRGPADGHSVAAG
jgi:cobaltochelatase CobS